MISYSGFRNSGLRNIRLRNIDLRNIDLRNIGLRTHDLKTKIVITRVMTLAKFHSCEIFVEFQQKYIYFFTFVAHHN